MAEQRVQRRLAAVLAADVVGYSRLMSEDETGTLAALQKVRAELFDPTIAQYRGRIVKLMGDGALVEFASVVDAVECALRIQHEIEERNAKFPDSERIAFRIGINLGDIIIDGDDIYGDGVNVASRLEGLCEPGEVYISGSVYDQAAGKLAASFEDLGEQTVKNIAKPIQVYSARVELNAGTGPKSQTADTPLPLPDKPSIAVLPFENLSGDPEQEYFADGLAENIITGLSKFHWFFVIARNSSFTYKGSVVDVKQVARELGVQYVLEGSVQKAGNRVRISAQLCDAPTGHHVWADRYDRKLEDIFALQDELTEAIVGAVAPSFVSAEATRVERKPPKSFDAWDYAMRGNWHLSRLNKVDVAEARRLFDKALEIDPKNITALSGLAFALGFSIPFGWVDNPDEARTTAYASGQRAVMQDPSDAEAHLAYSIGSFGVRQLDSAVAACQHALELNPNLAMAEGWLGCILSWRGDHEEAIVHAQRAARLSPNDSIYSWWSLAQTAANFGAGHYEQAVEWAKKVIEAAPEFPAPWRYLAASFAHLDRMADARAAKDQLLRIMPNESLRLVRAGLPSVDLDRMERFVDSLRKAGVPE